jgi:hypothetical protein
MIRGRYSSMTKIVSAAAFAASLTGIASADDSSMARIGGDSYTYFNSLPIDMSTSAWRQSNPNGLSELQFQALESSRLTDKPAPLFDMAPSAWRQSHRDGLPEREFEAMSSEAPAWHTDASNTTSVASSSNKEMLTDHAAALFHIAE